MTDKQRGALAATFFCLSIIFGAVAFHAAWNQTGIGVALAILFCGGHVYAGYRIWSDKP